VPDLDLLRALAPPIEPASPEVVARARPRARRRRGPLLLSAPIAAALIAALLLLTQDRQPFAEAAVKAAQGSPRILLEGWKVTRVDEWDAATGEMTFERDGRTIELRWPASPVKRGEGEVLRLKDAELRGEDLKQVHVERVSAEAWLKALPASAVTPRAQSAAIDEMLKGLPVPPGFTPPAATAETRDRYQLGAKIAGAVACAWIERWLDGDEDAANQLAGSRRWPILLEMNAAGDYPEVVWQYADAVNGTSTVPGGKLGLTVDGTYKDALGC
jgi:hypothetical protein